MGLSRARKRTLLGAGCVLALAAWIVPSQFSAERYHARLQAGLESVLHRPATFGTASFQLLPRPRFTLENVVVQEDGAFGYEPFARIDRIECDLRWSSVWRRKLDFDRLRMSRLSLNMVRDAHRQWNIETLLAQSGVTLEATPAGGGETPKPLEIEVDEARLNFKQGDLKQPFAVVDLQGRMEFDPGRKRVRFDLRGSPLRTDLPFPTPGLLEIAGEWSLGRASKGVFDASLRTRGALLYNWVPLLTGANYEIYGVMDADVRFQGSPGAIRIDGEASLNQLHRADLQPPGDALPIRLRYRGEYDSILGRLVVESSEAAFGDSILHLTGTVGNVRKSPDLDLVLALEHSQLEDWSRLARRLWRAPEGLVLAGRLDGLLTMQGRPGERRYGGFVTGRGARLLAGAGAFPFSDIALRLGPEGARLDPVTLTIAPRCAIRFEGVVQPARDAGMRGRGTEPPRYEIRAETRAADLREITRFARELGIPYVRAADAQGIGNALLLLKGTAWTAPKTSVSVKGEIRSARVLIPGLTEPLNIPRARFQISDQRLVIDSITAVIGSSVFSGRVEHSGRRTNPWEFDLKANALSVEQGAAWFDALGHRPSLALLNRIPGLTSLTNRRSVATSLFDSIQARGRFSTPSLTYRSLRLGDFEASLRLSDRILELSDVSFRSGMGRGDACAKVNMKQSPAEITGELRVADVRLETFSGRLPPALAKLHGSLSGVAQFRTRGLSRSEMSANLESQGSARLEKVGFGEFDPVAALVKRTGLEELDRMRREAVLKSATLAFSVKERQVSVADQYVEIDGAKLRLNGHWAFNGPLDMDVTADLREGRRPWRASGGHRINAPDTATIHLTGPLREIQAAPSVPASLASRSKVQ